MAGTSSCPSHAKHEHGCAAGNNAMSTTHICVSDDIHMRRHCSRNFWAHSDYFCSVQLPRQATYTHTVFCGLAGSQVCNCFSSHDSKKRETALSQTPLGLSPSAHNPPFPHTILGSKGCSPALGTLNAAPVSNPGWSLPTVCIPCRCSSPCNTPNLSCQ